MNQDKNWDKGPEALLEAWMKSAADFWGSMARIWTGASETSETATTSKKTDKSRVQESMDSALKMWKALSSTVGEPGAMDSLFQGINVLPKFLMKMAQTGWDGYFHLHQQWLERMGRIGQRTEAYKFENLDQDVFKVWNEIYEKEFKQFLNIPQLGLTRFYQERMGQFSDKFYQFQGAMAEFVYMLYLPMEKSYKVMQEKLEELTKAERLPENSQDYYRIWIKILEGHFMTLFKSPEYAQVQNKTLNAMEDFMIARQEYLQDVFQSLPIPTNKEMDELYKELHHLKKRLRQLEKKQTSG